MIVLDKQLAGGRNGRAKRVIVRREEVKIEAEFRSAYAVSLGGEAEVVDVVFGGGGGVEGELVLLERLHLRFGLGGGDHDSPCGDDGVGRPTSSLGK